MWRNMVIATRAKRSSRSATAAMSAASMSGGKRPGQRVGLAGNVGCRTSGAAPGRRSIPMPRCHRGTPRTADRGVRVHERADRLGVVVAAPTGPGRGPGQERFDVTAFELGDRVGVRGRGRRRTRPKMAKALVSFSMVLGRSTVGSGIEIRGHRAAELGCGTAASRPRGWRAALAAVLGGQGRPCRLRTSNRRSRNRFDPGGLGASVRSTGADVSIAAASWSRSSIGQRRPAGRRRTRQPTAPRSRTAARGDADVEPVGGAFEHGRCRRGTAR